MGELSPLILRPITSFFGQKRVRDEDKSDENSKAVVTKEDNIIYSDIHLMGV